MNADTIEIFPATSGLSPLSLKDAPSFIEVQFPVGRLSTRRALRQTEQVLDKRVHPRHGRSLVPWVVYRRRDAPATPS